MILAVSLRLANIKKGLLVKVVKRVANYQIQTQTKDLIHLVIRVPIVLNVSRNPMEIPVRGKSPLQKVKMPIACAVWHLHRLPVVLLKVRPMCIVPSMEKVVVIVPPVKQNLPVLTVLVVSSWSNANLEICCKEGMTIGGVKRGAPFFKRVMRSSRKPALVVRVLLVSFFLLLLLLVPLLLSYKQRHIN
jgi:hypothetical protein